MQREGHSGQMGFAALGHRLSFMWLCAVLIGSCGQTGERQTPRGTPKHEIHMQKTLSPLLAKASDSMSIGTITDLCSCLFGILDDLCLAPPLLVLEQVISFASKRHSAIEYVFDPWRLARNSYFRMTIGLEPYFTSRARVSRQTSPKGDVPCDGSSIRVNYSLETDGDKTHVNLRFHSDTSLLIGVDETSISVDKHYVRVFFSGSGSIAPLKRGVDVIRDLEIDWLSVYTHMYLDLPKYIETRNQSLNVNSLGISLVIAYRTAPSRSRTSDRTAGGNWRTCVAVLAHSPMLPK